MELRKELSLLEKELIGKATALTDTEENLVGSIGSQGAFFDWYQFKQADVSILHEVLLGPDYGIHAMNIYRGGNLGLSVVKEYGRNIRTRFKVGGQISLDLVIAIDELFEKYTDKVPKSHWV